MRPLNVEAPRRGRWLPIEAPETKVLHLYGRRVVLDVNTLAVAELDAAEAPDDFGAAVKPQFPLRPRAAVGRLVLNVTHACNLACGYCFAARYRSAPAMAPEVACGAIERLFDPRRDLAISFFGGEPLLAWRTVAAAMDHAERLARARGVRASFHITTNATLLDAAKAGALRRRNCSLLVSLDGPADLHNAARPARDPRLDSHAATMAALGRMKALGMARRVTARATYPMDAPRLVERLAFLAALQDEGTIAGFSIEPAVMAEGCGGRGGEEYDADALRREYHDAARLFVRRLREGRRTNFFHFRKLLSRLLHRQVTGSECGAGVGYLAVGPDGTLYACHREAGTRIGHLETGVDEERRCAWLDNRLYTRPACRACWARHLCGGGCRQIAAEQGRPLTEIFPPRCFVMRTIVRECLWILAEVGPAALRRRL